MKEKIVSAADAIAIVRDGDTVAFSGFVGAGTPEELIAALEKRFVETGSPRDLTLVFAAAPGDGKERGLNRLARDGLVKRAIGGHWSLVPKLAAMAVDGRIEAYNLPLGTLSQLFRDIAGTSCRDADQGRPAHVRRPAPARRQDQRAHYRGPGARDDHRRRRVALLSCVSISVSMLRGTTADMGGNITMEREALTLDNLALAMAARNSNGFVITQVERLCAHGALNPRHVQIPRVLVDCVVVAKPENHLQTYATPYSPAFSGEFRVTLDTMTPMDLDERKIIARRCAFELPMGGVVNLGIGMPEGVAQVANEEKVLRYVTLTAEPGVIGGLPQSGLDFGAAINTDAVIHQNQQFDFYDGGGLDMACLGMAQVDASGNVNVSRFGPRLAGAGGFINISQSARRLLFAGTFTTGGLIVAFDDGELKIVREGRARKFIKEVEQITFNGAYAAETGQPVLYVTERCVFRRSPEGMELIEVAPGIDIERDILAHMDFTPIVRGPRLMAARIFHPAPMQLEETLLGLQLAERISYDVERNTVFLNLEGHQVRNRDDVDRVRRVVEELCQQVGRKVALVVNYDNFVIDPAVADTYAAMVRYMETHYYTTSSRYTTSAFLRMKLGEALARRRVAPHIFETADEAHAYVQDEGDAPKDFDAA